MGRCSTASGEMLFCWWEGTVDRYRVIRYFSLPSDGPSYVKWLRKRLKRTVKECKLSKAGKCGMLSSSSFIVAIWCEFEYQRKSIVVSRSPEEAAAPR